MITYLGDRVSAGGECVIVVTESTACWLVKIRDGGKLLYGSRFSLMLKVAVYMSYVRPARS